MKWGTGLRDNEGRDISAGVGEERREQVEERR